MTARREQRKRFPIRHTWIPAAEMTKTGAKTMKKESAGSRPMGLRLAAWLPQSAPAKGGPNGERT